MESPLLNEQVELGAQFVQVAGWQIPQSYGSAAAEHQAVRHQVGLWDGCHLGELEIRGTAAAAFLDYALVSVLSELPYGQAKYTLLCDQNGGVVSDLLVLRRDWDHYIVVGGAEAWGVVTAALAERSRNFQVSLQDISPEIGLLSMQGPRAVQVLAQMCDLGADDVAVMARYAFVPLLLRGGIHVLAVRTGSTGEDGFELLVAADQVAEVWRLALAVGAPAGLTPVGQEAMESLRLEAAFPAVGKELSPDWSPFSAGFGKLVEFHGADGQPREFVGRAALEATAQAAASGDLERILVGLVSETTKPDGGQFPPFACSGDAVRSAADAKDAIGIVTSGGPAITLGTNIALALVAPEFAQVGQSVTVAVGADAVPMVITPLPFYRRS